jgi:hypothetical protein
VIPTDLANLLGIVIVLYMVGGVSYFWYHAFKISRTAVGVNNRIRFFSRMLHNPFWMTLEQKTLSLQTSELNAYASRIEIQKYYFIAGGILIVASAVILARALVSHQFLDLTFRALMIFVFVCASYFLYQAYKISKYEKPADEKLRLYFAMLFNPFWRIIERDALISQGAVYRKYITKLEIKKYVAMSIIFIGGILVVALQKL